MIDKENKAAFSKIGSQLQTNPVFKIGEILLLFILGFAFIKLILPMAGNNPLYKQLVAAATSILILIYVWVGLKLRGESWKDFGLTFGSISWREGFKGFLLSLFVAVLGIAGFLMGSVVMVVKPSPF